MFPACVACNNETSSDEALLAWLIRVRLNEFKPAADRELERACVELRRRYPDVWDAVRFNTRAETRQFLRQAKIQVPSLGVGDVVHTMEVPKQIMDAANRYGAKLGKALHYFHTEKIVPPDAKVSIRVFTNGNAISSNFPNQVFSILTDEAKIQRAETSLKDQFDYRFAIVEEGAASAFVISLGDGLLIVASIFCDAARYKQSKLERDLFAQSSVVASPAPPFGT